MAKQKKERLDLILVQEGLAPTRQKAQALIMAGAVYFKQQKITKAGTGIPLEEVGLLEVRGKLHPYVSRGGLKLEKAVTLWGLDFTGFVCGDIGASTGGFTDCMLQNGAKFVYAVDSGYNQLDWKLRTDPRVDSMERCNARYLTNTEIPQALDFFSVDVSFISLKLILPPLLPLMKEGGQAVCLVKPQFEAGREQVGKKGVVRDPKVHLSVLESCVTEAKTLGYGILGLSYSPIRGPEGNIEYLLYLSQKQEDCCEICPKTVVEEAHSHCTSEQTTQEEPPPQED